ncbi:MAG: hypothetical protein ACNA7W_04885 [Pseudomonadales bacterium]
MKAAAGPAFGIGVLAAVVITTTLWLARAVGITDMNLELLKGALLTGNAGAMTWAIGLGIHLITGGVLAVVYAAIFETWRRAGWRRGIAIAIPHALLSGILLGFLPAIQPAIAEHPALRPAGFLAVNMGWISVVLFFLLHVIYGAMVGAAYRVPLPAPADRRPMPVDASSRARKRH